MKNLLLNISEWRQWTIEEGGNSVGEPLTERSIAAVIWASCHFKVWTVQAIFKHWCSLIKTIYSNVIMCDFEDACVSKSCRLCNLSLFKCDMTTGNINCAFKKMVFCKWDHSEPIIYDVFKGKLSLCVYTYMPSRVIFLALILNNWTLMFQLVEAL